jgi:hypothetical protein
MNLFVYWEYMEWICLYTENTQNESVRILRIRGMNLFVYWEYAEQICTYTENTRNARKVEYLSEFETKIENILRCLSGAYSRWVRSPKSLKIKKSPLRTLVVENNRKRTHGFLLNSNIKAITVFRQMIDEAMHKIKHGQLLTNEKKKHF